MKNQSVWPVLLLILLPLASVGQSISKIQYDSLDYFLKIGDTIEYYKCLSRQAKIAAEKLKNKAALDQLSTYLEPVFTGVSKTYYPRIRKTSSIFASKYMRSFGEYHQAEFYYLLAHRYAVDSILLDDQAWYVENELMNIYNRADEYEKAEYFLNLTQNSLSYQIQHSTNNKEAKEFYSRLHVNIGRLEESKGQMEKAMATYKRGLVLAREVNTEKGIQGNATNLADLAIQVDSLELAGEMIGIAALAMDSLNDESDYRERLASVTSVQAKYCFKKALTNHDTSDAAACMPMFCQAIDTLNRYQGYRPSREVSKYLVEYADALLDIGMPDAASQVLAEALNNILVRPRSDEEIPPQEILYRENTFIQVFESYTRLFNLRYQQTQDSQYLTKAIHALDNAIYVNDLILNQVADDPSKLLAVRTNKKLVHQELDAVYTLYQKTRAPEYLDKARDLFNRSKSLLLEEKIRQSQTVAHLTEMEKRSLRDWQVKLREAYQYQLDTRFRQDSLSRVIFTLKNAINEFLAVKEGQWKKESIIESYLEYSVFEDEVMAYFHFDQIKGWTKLGPKKDLDRLIAALNAYLTSPLMDNDQVLSELYQFLIAPLTGYLPDHFTVIPDGVIGTIPFDILKDTTGQMLIRHHTVHYAHSYTTLSDTTKREEPTYEICLLAPEYSEDRPDISASRGSLYPLKYNQMEIDSIARLYGQRASTPRIEDDRTLLDSIASAEIFHFAGHAIVNADGAFLALSAKNIPDQQLTLEELSTLKRGPRLVVLSACETGLGQFEIGEGIRSLGRSFAEAGTKASVISLWNVDDRSTSRIMTSFYKNLLSGYSVTEALRNAKLEYISVSEDGMEHPYFWAGFVCTE